MVLLYGICPRDLQPNDGLPNGVGGGVPFFVNEGEFSAVCSEVNTLDKSPGVDNLFAFARVIDALGKVCPLLPMRFGNFLEIDQVPGFLRCRAVEFLEIIEEIQGKFEMTVWLPADQFNFQNGLNSNPLADPSGPCISELKSVESGSSYLKRRMEYYRNDEHQIRKTQEIQNKLREHFSGLFTRDVIEFKNYLKRPMSASCFLVPREKVVVFRDRFQVFKLDSDNRAYLTGPWSPNHFAMPGASGSGHQEFAK